MNEAEFEIRRAFPAALRVGLAAAGLICIALALWQSRHAFAQLSVVTLFFGLILAGALFVGGSFLWAALLGEEQLWRFSRGRLYVLRQSLLRRAETQIGAGDVARTEVGEIVWDSRAPTFNVIVHLRSGARFETADMSRAAAEALEARIRRALRL